MKTRVLLILSVLVCIQAFCLSAVNNPTVVLETNLGNIVVELFNEKAPITVDNFLGYVNSGYYDYLLFHRVIEDFMIQGGAYYLYGSTIYYWPPNQPPIINESYNGLSNLRGTIAMARTSAPNSATSQFYINHVDNPELDKANASDGIGYCVFGQVIEGMYVVDAIASVPTTYVSANLADFPNNPTVVIFAAYVRVNSTKVSSNFSADTQNTVDIEDLALFVLHWLNACNSANDFCEGRDLDYSGRCDFKDFNIFAYNWLK